jgi:DNA-directed RNA polymerase specialized sigma24 family protein
MDRLSFRDSSQDMLIARLRRFAMVLLGEREAADDIVQEALAEISAHHDKTRVRAWSMRLFALVSKLAAAYLPASAPARAHPAGPFSLGGLNGPEILSRFASLPRDEREILFLVAVEGFSYADCATIVSIPVEVVLSRLARARAALLDNTTSAEAGGRQHLRLVT